MPQGFIDISMTGDKQLQMMLDSLEKKDAKRITKQATRDGAKYLHQRVLLAVPVDTGLLLSLMSRIGKTIVSIKRTRRGFFGYAIQTPPRSDFPPNTKGITDKAYYPAIIEYGKKDGTLAPHPYIRGTTEESRPAVLLVFAKSLRTRINKFVAKYAKRRAA